MKKVLLILAGALALSVGTQAQVVYNEPFTGTTLPTGWGAPSAYTLTVNNKLMVTMNDSIGPKGPGSTAPPAEYANFYYALAVADTFNMAVGCKCLTFDIDNTGNPELTLFVQAGDDKQNVGGVTNHYTNQTVTVIAANYVGPVTVNFAGLFHNYNYATSTINAYLDSTKIKSFDFQPVGHNAGVKFKGNFTIDNFTIPHTPEINVTKGTSAGATVLTNGTATLTDVVNGQTGSAQTFTIQNTGSAALTISSIVLSGTNASEFTLSTPLPTSIANGTNGNFTVTFAPTSVGAKTAKVTITSNDIDEASYVINLTTNGTAVATAVSAAQANISSSKLYPNPGTDMVNVELNLVNASDVKVTLSDVLGKEVMTIANGNMTSLSQSFSVANLHKGIYNVNYFINGSAAKAELLMVK